MELKHTLSAEARAARYEMALLAVSAVSEDSNVLAIVHQALNVPMVAEEKPVWKGSRI